jgi:methyltransferase OMS1, mitochondrial
MSSSPPPLSKQQRHPRQRLPPKSQYEYVKYHSRLSRSKSIPLIASRKLSPLPQTLRRRPLPPSPPTPKPFQKGVWIIGGIAVYCLSTYTFFLYRSYNNAVAASQTHNVPLDVSDRYNKTARTYDSDVNLMEKAMWLGRLRKQLIHQATGHVLEVSVGTGRNMQFYSPKTQCKTLTFVDQSPEMIAIAREKFKQLHPLYRKVVFRTQSAAEPILLPDPHGFDTIVQTMGLCSTPDPEGLLRNLGRLVNKQGGRVLLLEHGRSHYAWVNGLLDSLAPAHADRHGCWWNRDIGGIVGGVEGGVGGLQVVSIQRYHLGTTWMVEMRRDVGEDEKEMEKERN